jgi:hypothetical protein
MNEADTSRPSAISAPVDPAQYSIDPLTLM